MWANRVDTLLRRHGFALEALVVLGLSLSTMANAQNNTAWNYNVVYVAGGEVRTVVITFPSGYYQKGVAGYDTCLTSASRQYDHAHAPTSGFPAVDTGNGNLTVESYMIDAYWGAIYPAPTYVPSGTANCFQNCHGYATGRGSNRQWDFSIVLTDDWATSLAPVSGGIMSNLSHSVRIARVTSACPPKITLTMEKNGPSAVYYRSYPAPGTTARLPLYKAKSGGGG